MDKRYKHATDMEERLRRASDASIVSEQDARAAVAKWRENHSAIAGHWPAPHCTRCNCSIHYYDQMVPGDQVTADGTPDQLFCLDCASALSRERRHSRDPVEDFNPTRWAVLSAVIILVIITLNVI